MGGVCVVTLIMSISLVIVSASPAPQIRMQFCGSELADKLSLLCSPFGYNDPFNNLMRFESQSLDPISPIRLRVRRGVADDCCKTGCTLDTMEQYCSMPLTEDQKSRFLEQTQSHASNHIPEDAGSQSVALRHSATARDQKNDLDSKVRGHHDKKGRRGNNRCRCRRRRRRGKGDIEDLEQHQNQINPVIGTINPSYLGIPVILSPRIQKEGILKDFKKN